MSFTGLFVHFNDCPRNTTIEIQKNDHIKLYSKLQRFKQLFANKQAENTNTVTSLLNLVENWSFFQKLSETERTEIRQKITNKKCDSKKLQVTAGFVRQLYRDIISKQLTGFEKVAATTKENNKKIAIRDEKNSLEKRNIVKSYNTELCKRWGTEHVKRILPCTKVYLNKYEEKANSLRIKHIKAIGSALISTHDEDVQAIYSVIKEAINSKSAETLKALPTRVQDALKRDLKVDTLDKAFKELKKRFKEVKEKYTELTPENIQFLIKLEAATPEELELSLLGKRVEGVVAGHYRFMHAQRWRYSKRQEDKELAQIFQEIYEMNGEWKEWETSYLELLTKFLIKKEICRHQDHNTYKGMLIPAPGGEWYRVENKFMKNGKHALFMKPLCHPEKHPSLIVYMSTASSPAHTDATATIWHDTSPNGPGYLGKKWDNDYAESFCHNLENDLIICGHSLGGCFAQYRIVDTWTGKKTPKSKVKLVCFDTPAIGKKDAEIFAKWTKDNLEIAEKNIILEYYLSKSDWVPGAGKRHVGYGCPDQLKKNIIFKVLDKKIDAVEPEVAILNAHGRFYFRNKKTISQHVSENVNLEEFDKRGWRKLAESVRLFASFILFPITGLYVLLRWLVGSCVSKLTNRAKKIRSNDKVVYVPFNELRQNSKS